jgi:hypothetical protein
MFKCLYTKKKNKMSASLGNLFQFGDSSKKDPFSSKKKENMNNNSDSEDEDEKEEESFSNKKKLIEGKGKKKSKSKSKPKSTDSSEEQQQQEQEETENKIDDNGSEEEDTEDTGDAEEEDEGFHNMNQKHGNKVPFWVTNPNVLLDSRYITEWFPVEGMSYNQKLNAISRLVILLTIVSFVFLKAIRLLWIGGVCLFVIFLLHYSQTRSVGGGKQEGFFGNVANDKLRGTDPALHAIVKFATNDPSKIGKTEYFDVPKINNPYNNVLVTDIVDNPDKLPAPPAYYPETEKAILDRTKEAIQKMNPTFPGIMKKLFSSFDDHFEFEQSMRQFHSNPSTTVPNDQGAFAEFCYGEMISCKEGNQFACARDSARYNLY